jgi:hypothetical protein
MATLSAAELQNIRNGCASQSGIPVNYTKAQINAAAQACEDFLTNNATAVSTAINTATSPLVLTAAQKKAIFAWVVEQKFERDK